MKTIKTILAALAVLVSAAGSNAQDYTPSEGNLQARKDFVNERFGIFLHWGIYASYAQGEWYLNTGELNKDEYAKAASAFYPVNYNAEQWVKAFKDAGAGYVTITSRHHDGFSMFDTKASDYNIVKATPYGKDVMKDLDEACQKEGLKLQFYYSLLDWIREDYPLGDSGKFTGRKGDAQNYDSYFAFMKAQVKELLTQYHTRALWFDGYWDHRKDAVPFDWRMPEFYEYIHSINPDCLICNNHHIAPIVGEDYQTFERDLPGRNEAGYSAGQEVSTIIPIEMCQTMNHSWGYSVADQDYKSVGTLVRLLAQCVSMNCNMLMNIGPQANGELPAAALERLKGMGEWMKVNSESIRGCGPGPIGEQDWGVSTAPIGNNKVFYLHLFKSPGAVIEIPVSKRTRVLSVTSLADGSKIATKKVGEKLFVTVPGELPEDSDYVIKVNLK
ncbi:MAG: alpha-L-fucosidase [Bacteroidales bacterium]|nr:alpha-L-fucosidase [Bacteroidales bacterium]